MSGETLLHVDGQPVRVKAGSASDSGRMPFLADGEPSVHLTKQCPVFFQDIFHPTPCWPTTKGDG